MLVIKYHGHSCFEVYDDGDPEKNIIFDPFDRNTGDFSLDVSAWLVLCSHDHFDHNAWKRVAKKGTKHYVGYIGTDVINDVKVKGVGTFHDPSLGALRGKNTVYVVKMNDFIIAHLGDIGHLLEESNIKEIMEWGRINVLFVPTGGIYTIDPAQAITIIHQLNPNIAIPMHYRHEKHNKRIFGRLSTLDEFVKIAKEGFKVNFMDSNMLSIDKQELPEKTEIFILKA